MMLRDTMKSWSDSQSDLYSSDQEEEEQMIFGENEDDLEEMMDLSDLPTSLFACSVHEAVFEVQEEKVRWREVYLGHSIVSIDTAIEQLWIFTVFLHIIIGGEKNNPKNLPGELRSEWVQLPKSR